MTKSIYHVTPASNLNQILKEGLLPKIGARSLELGEITPAVYCFDSRESVDNALMNWLGEAFEENEKLLVLEFLVEPEWLPPLLESEFEYALPFAVSPQKLLKLWSEDWTLLSFNVFTANLEETLTP